ncbi:hypothetical protein Isop_0558 [Isosphaera pallida ATCC 43644]|jgi:F0F1-type ATP synthase assembly protein I|uniref:Uncharacterized protein n=2 Tax=Isosphaera pallida TaxID=128 RepID=E8R033_ISOPI|nr:hypothetical protein Isop_0558 [Isosphaera pallida ATCC 43644]
MTGVSVALFWATQISIASMDFMVCVCLGWWLDRVWNLKPWLTLAGTFTGLIAMFSHLAVLAVRAARPPHPVPADSASSQDRDRRHDDKARSDSQRIES